MGFSSGMSITSIASGSDVALNLTVNADVLTYNSTLQKWVNKPIPSNGATGTLETAVALGANAIFTGQPHDGTSKIMVTVAAESDKTYTLTVQQSNDAAAWTTTFAATPTINTGAYYLSTSIPLRRYNYYRLVLTNGSTTQTYLTLSSYATSGS